MVSISVLLLQSLLFVIVPSIGSFRKAWSPEGLLAAMLAGFAVQGVLGTVWNFGSWGMVWMELLMYAVVAVVFGRILVDSLPFAKGSGQSRWSWLLPLIFLLTWVVRSIHPLETWALGQSDAYGHLGFIEDILSLGAISNPVYPPAYAWIMALPAFFIENGPYWVARFGGAFFGIGLVLALYVLTCRLATPRAALITAALAAGFPLFYLLQKTSVGAFANGLGLFFIPTALWAYWLWREQGYTVHGLLLLFTAVLGAAVIVPMMSIHLSLLIFLFHLTLGLMSDERGNWGRGTYSLGLMALFLLVAVIALLLRVPLETLHVTVGMIVGKESPALPCTSKIATLALLVKDYFTVKRWGFGSWPLNLGALITSLCFAASLVGGLLWRRPGWLLCGLWGGLASVHVHLGLFQFTSYQREGWSLLLCSALFCGLSLAWFWEQLACKAWRHATAAVLIIASCSGLVIYPSHRLLSSPAESEMVRLLLALRGSVQARQGWEHMSSLWQIADAEGVVVVARPMAGFSDGQGDMVRALMPDASSDAAQAMETGKPVVFLRDRKEKEIPISWAVRILQPHLGFQVDTYHAAMESANLALEGQFQEYDHQIKWDVSCRLEVRLFETNLRL